MTLPERIRRTAAMMRKTGNEMAKRDDVLRIKFHGAEMLGAADIAESWAREIEKLEGK